jgi:hypothetical protein
MKQTVAMPDFELSLGQFAQADPYSKCSIRNAVDVVEATGFVQTGREETAR